MAHAIESSLATPNTTAVFPCRPSIRIPQFAGVTGHTTSLSIPLHFLQKGAFREVSKTADSATNHPASSQDHLQRSQDRPNQGRNRVHLHPQFRSVVRLVVLLQPYFEKTAWKHDR